ncbi:helix-turn-helix domain-containing protein [Adlercreutzia equolifaciens]
MYRLMAGKSGVSIDAMVGIATALGTTPGELLDGLEVER